MKPWYYIFVCALCLTSQNLFAQPATDIFLLDLDLSSDPIVVSSPVNITNRMGYDNQPSFSPDGSYLLYTSIRDNQADIYTYNLTTQATQQIIQTPTTSEYSPQIMPDGEHVSVVRVEHDGKTQRMWQFSLSGKEEQLLMPKVQPVGYYTWYTAENIAMFILGKPNTLQYTNFKEQNLSGFDFNLGRSLHTIPGTNKVSFVDKSSAATWEIKSWDSKSEEIVLLTQTLSEREDYCWTPDGRMLMGKDAHLFIFDPKQPQEGWQNLGNLGVGDFNRLACSPFGKKLAIVADRTE